MTMQGRFIMKNAIKRGIFLFGIIVLAVIVICSFASCSNEPEKNTDNSPEIS